MTTRSIEQFIERVTPRLRYELRARLPHLHAEHDAILNNALLALLDYWAVPGEWQADEEQQQALALVVLRRKAVDFNRALHRHRLLSELEGVSAYSGDGDPSNALDYARQLVEVLKLIDALDPSEQALLLREGRDDDKEPLSPSERKKLSRIRSELKANIRLRSSE